MNEEIGIVEVLELGIIGSLLYMTIKNYNSGKSMLNLQEKKNDIKLLEDILNELKEINNKLK